LLQFRYPSATTWFVTGGKWPESPSPSPQAAALEESSTLVKDLSMNFQMRQDKMTGDHFIHTKPAFVGDAPRVANTVLVDFIGATAATHYGNPFDGACQSDEKNLTDITGGGAVCGAKCGIGKKCPTDVPAGMNAKPSCWHSVGLSTYCVNLCTSDADCGNMGKCEAVGSKTACTYSGPSGPSPGPSPGPAPGPAPGPTPGPAPAGKTHYGDPSKGCMSDEQAVQITGVSGDFCAPDCASAACPTDVPAGVTAKPQCALKAGTGTDKKCALICSPAGKIDEASLRAGDAQCGAGASCKAIQSTGICTYDDGPAPAKTHYGDPSNGCLPDEFDQSVTGVNGDFCAPSCTSAACPTDVPAGVTAQPQCALTGSGNTKDCALICSPAGKIDEASLRAGDAQCGAGASCKAIQSTGICTYDDGSAQQQLLLPQAALPALPALRASGSTADGGCCGASCSSSSDCAVNLFCCPNHNECMGDDTKSTAGPDCDACNHGGPDLLNHHAVRTCSGSAPTLLRSFTAATYHQTAGNLCYEVAYTVCN
jgi:hypothetical protein